MVAERKPSTSPEELGDGQRSETPDRDNEQHYLDRAADVWALGLSLYAMLFGKLPFTLIDPTGGDHRKRYAEAVQSDITFRHPAPNPTTEGLVRVLQHMLARAPEDRWTAQEAHDALSGNKSIQVPPQEARSSPVFEVERTLSDILPAEGRHEKRECTACAGILRTRAATEQLADAKVAQQRGAAVVQENVRWLNVAVHDAVPMQILQTGAQLSSVVVDYPR